MTVIIVRVVIVTLVLESVVIVREAILTLFLPGFKNYFKGQGGADLPYPLGWFYLRPIPPIP